MKPITLAVTSCARHDLLERTLRSFDRYAGSELIEETVIVEDSLNRAPEWLAGLANIGSKTWITNGRRRAQIYSCDRAMAEIRTPFVFWCEDDWEFCRPGFLQESLRILETWPQIVQVWIRDDSAHPVVQHSRFPFPIMQPNWSGGWSGFCFNPGLRRLAEYKAIGSYGRHVGYDTKRVGELHLSKLYLDQGFFAAKLPAACHHIGEGNRHVSWETAPKTPRVLLAIPACHRYDYTKAQHQVPRSQMEERLAAQRATWLKDVPGFASYVEQRYFYGSGGARSPEADEVFLDCPDDYMALPRKMQAIYGWALSKGFDYVFKCDDDTFVYLDRLMASGFEQFDYTGFCVDRDEVVHRSYISGGPGYWLSRKALEILTRSPIDHWAEDLWTGRHLLAAGIRPHRDARYLPGFDNHYVKFDQLPERHGYISFHAALPDDMRRLYEPYPSPTFMPVDQALNEPAPAKRPAVAQKLFQVAQESFEHFAAPKAPEKPASPSPRILIAILACHQRQPARDAQRRTWLKDAVRLAVEYRYFLGRNGAEQKPTDDRRPKWAQAIESRPAAPDEVILDVPDRYETLPLKTRGLLSWAFIHGYDYVFKCDDDTYVRVDRLLSSGFEQHEYFGFRRAATFPTAAGVEHAQGGAGYWLNRRAMELVVCAGKDYPQEGAEDITVARILASHGLIAQHDERYRPALDRAPLPSNDVITVHQVKPDAMFEIHQNFEEVPA